MNYRDIVICSIDLLTICLTLALIALFAVNYDQDKGIGDLDYIAITELESSDLIDGNLKSFNFYPIRLFKNEIVLSHYYLGVEDAISKYNTVEELKASGVLDNDKVYVIYEIEHNSYFSEIIRLMISNSIPVGVADLSS